MIEDITLEQVIEGFKTLFEDAKIEMGVDEKIDEETRPLVFFKSEVLVTLIGRLEDLLDIKIPENCYPFFDKEKLEQLTIKEAAGIILNKATK
jgi:hypothetical protein